MENELMKNELNFNAKEAFTNYQEILSKLVKLSYDPELLRIFNDLLDHALLKYQEESDEKVKQAYEMFVKKDQEALLDSSLDKECPVDEKVFGEEKSVDDFSILNLIPEQAKKWVGRLTVDEMTKAINDANRIEGYMNEDEFIGELVDRIKDMAIAKYTNDILAGRITEIDDEEIKSEVLDYMTKKDLEIPATLKPKTSYLENFLNKFKSDKCDTPAIDPIDKYIAQLDNGETLEFSNDILTQIVDRLWDTRNNVNIKIHNNKISLR